MSHYNFGVRGRNFVTKLWHLTCL